MALAISLGRFPEVVATAAARLEPHDVANYLRELAADLHSFYNAHKILEAAPETRAPVLPWSPQPARSLPMAWGYWASRHRTACDVKDRQDVPQTAPGHSP